MAELLKDMASVYSLIIEPLATTTHTDFGNPPNNILRAVLSSLAKLRHGNVADQMKLCPVVFTITIYVGLRM